MFGRKRKNVQFYVDDSPVIAYDFRLRSTIVGFEDYRDREYQPYNKLEEEEMLPMLEDYLAKLLKDGCVDAANAGLLDEIIFSAAREAAADLDWQYQNHTDTLRRLLIRHEADCEDLRRLVAERREECDRLEADYKATCRILAKDSPEVDENEQKS